MKWLGLTGGIACGKSTVAQIFRDLGFIVVDADQVARDVMKPGTKAYTEIIQAFGQDLVEPDQSLNRRRLGQKVFGQPEALSKLEHILHPRVKQAVRSQRESLQLKGEEFAIYDVPLLFEKNMADEFDLILCVTARPELQRARMKARNLWTDEEIESRLAAQLTLDQKVHASDIVVENNGTQSELEAQVKALIPKLKMASRRPHK